MTRIRSKDIKIRLKDIQEFILEEYKEKHRKKQRNWRTYEQRLSHRIKNAIHNLEPLIDEAVNCIKIRRGKGRRPELTLKQKVVLLLLKIINNKSNRSMSSMLTIFSILSKINVSYKTIERLYSDPEVEIAIYNLHILILRKKGISDVDATGDGTGYSLTIRKHYATEVEKRKDKAKKIGKVGKKLFVYSFKLLDLKTKMYIAYGMSFKSEKEAFEAAIKMLKKIKM